MITKERLEELIEQKATIYEAKYHNINNVKLDKDLIVVVNDKYIHFRPYYGEKYQFHKYLKNLFETEEEARWELEMTATRTETLKLPTWEEFNNQDKLITFRTYPHNYHLLKYGKYIVIRAFYGQGGMDIFVKPLTEENYIEACKLCKKLFLGEE